MENNNFENKSSNDFIENSTKKIDCLIGKIYNENLIIKFANFSLVKTIFENNLFKGLNEWFSRNFKTITNVLGWLALIGGIILFLTTPLTGFLNLFDRYSRLSLYMILYIINGLALSIITFVSGVGFLKNKKWTPFITILRFFIIIGGELIVNLTKYFSISRYLKFNQGISSIIIRFILMIIISGIYTCLILKNKDKFIN